MQPVSLVVAMIPVASQCEGARAVAKPAYIGSVPAREVERVGLLNSA